MAKSLPVYDKMFRFCGNKVANPEGARLVHLARSGSQSEHRIRFILHACGARHIIKNTTELIFLLLINSWINESSDVFTCIKLHAV